MKLAVTGHRPDKLGGYKDVAAHEAVRKHMLNFLLSAIQADSETSLISGGALGVDQYWIEIGLQLQIPVVAALPFKGYNSLWHVTTRQKYEALLDKCHEVRYICEPGYAASKMQRRNEWMVDNCDMLVAYWNGTPGGTDNCIKYAISVKRAICVFDTEEIINCLKR